MEERRIGMDPLTHMGAGSIFSKQQSAYEFIAFAKV